MRGLGKFLGFLCAVLFIVTGVLVLLLFNLERGAFSAATYKQAFAQQHLYERMPALLATTLQTSISQNPNAFPFLKELSVEDWRSTISALLPPEELQVVADSALDSTFAYVNGKTDSAVLSLLPVKAHLAGDAGVVVIRQFLKTQPDCTIEQLTQIGLGFLSGDIALCNPPAEAMGLVDTLIQSQLQTINAVIPNEVVIIAGASSGTPNDPRLRLHMVRSAIQYSPFFVFLLLLAMTLFAVRGFRDFLLWWGWPLLIVGTAGILIGLIGSSLVGAVLEFLIRTQGTFFLPPLLISTIAETASAVAGQMLTPVIIQGLILAILGFGMVLVSLFVSRRTTYTIS